MKGITGIGKIVFQRKERREDAKIAKEFFAVFAVLCALCDELAAFAYPVIASNSNAILCMSATTTNRLRKRILVRERLTPRRLVVTLVVLLAILLLFAIIALSVGSERVGLDVILKIIASQFTNKSSDISAEQVAIIADIRLPRVLMAIVVGAALSVAGAAFQALLRNPLADPGILGISAGSALGAIAAIWLRLPPARGCGAFFRG